MNDESFAQFWAPRGIGSSGESSQYPKNFEKINFKEFSSVYIESSYNKLFIINIYIVNKNINFGPQY